MDEHKMTQQEEIREREALFVLYVLAGGIVAVILWVAHARLYLTNQQLIELAARPLLAILLQYRCYATLQLASCAVKSSGREQLQ